MMGVAKARRDGSPRRLPPPSRWSSSGRRARPHDRPARRARAPTARAAAAGRPPRRRACSPFALQGFKSFAERTNVEFGGGISAVVGPNGSGKSNLADALRWALGEQGRALRSRKAEDVIWAGSEKRAAQGMADVTLVLDNGDGLLPVDFQVLELGRRLYRSGENDYLLNKQRIRLRDLVDLLDAAHLADNAFLFIGQGMVDQALALRPEERRPLFEEVAGVRRHERRRRKAEDQLAESEANLARVEDIVGELRPQAQRLAAQAEQQATRSSTATSWRPPSCATHARWHEAAARPRTAEPAATRARRGRPSARGARGGRVRRVGARCRLSARAVVERERREAHEAARAALTAIRLRDGRSPPTWKRSARDRRRLAEEREAAEADAAAAADRSPYRSRARPRPRGGRLGSRARARRGAGGARALRSASQARGEELAALRRAEGARQAELETARRRLADAERRLAEAQAAATKPRRGAPRPSTDTRRRTRPSRRRDPPRPRQPPTGRLPARPPRPPRRSARQPRISPPPVPRPWRPCAAGSKPRPSAWPRTSAARSPRRPARPAVAASTTTSRSNPGCVPRSRRCSPNALAATWSRRPRSRRSPRNAGRS